MIEESYIDEVLENYNTKELTIGTIGSHSALNILKGAEELNLNTICICSEDSEITYDLFDVGDEVITVNSYGKKHDIDTSWIFQRLFRK